MSKSTKITIAGFAGIVLSLFMALWIDNVKMGVFLNGWLVMASIFSGFAGFMAVVISQIEIN